MSFDATFVISKQQWTELDAVCVASFADRIHVSTQIIATSHDLTLNGGLVREISLFQGNLGWWNIIIWPDVWHIYLQLVDFYGTCKCR